MKPNTAPDPKSADFTNLVDLLAVFSEATHHLAEMAANLNSEMMVCIDGYKADYSAMQKTLTEAETALEIIAIRHPEWFKETRGLKTPYGTVKFTSSNPLVVSNEELAIELIERDAHRLGLDPENLIRERKELNLEALETLTPEQLAAFRVKRVKKENFSIVAAKIDLGKAVKEAAEKTAA
jgi:Bacteriophage Mu Gam like protein